MWIRWSRSHGKYKGKGNNVAKEKDKIKKVRN
jgi:hypothetical protein